MSNENVPLQSCVGGGLPPLFWIAVRRSGGGTVAVSEAGILEALNALVRSGFYVEPTSATAAAAFEMLCETGDIRPGETTVVVLTGSGLKASAFMTETFSR